MASSKSYVYPLVVIGILFGALGFITWVNGVLIPYFQLGLELTHVQSFLVTFASYGAYFIMSIPSAFVLRRTGYKKGISLGLIVMAVGSILFLPAANYRIYGMFLTGLFVTGTGMALLQTAVNPYIVIMGPQESAAQRIGFMGVSNKVAGILSQSVLGTFFLVGASEITKSLAVASPEEKEMILGDYVRRVEGPYLIITIVLLLLSVFIFFSGLPEVKEKGEDTDLKLKTSVEKVKVVGIFKFPYLILGIIALFVSGACEVIPIDGVISYAGSLGIPLDDARYFGAYSLYCMVFGYILSIVLIPKYISQERALLYVSITGVILSLLSYFSSGMTAVVFIITMGFVSAWLWGTIWGLAIRQLGRYTKLGSAVLMMSVVGGGIFPLIFGSLLDVFPRYPQSAILMLVPCYLYLSFYAVRGSKITQWKTS